MKKKKNQQTPPVFIAVKLIFLIAVGVGAAMMAEQLTGVPGETIPLLTAISAATVFTIIVEFLVKARALRSFLLVGLWFVFAWMNRAKLIKGAQIAAVFVIQTAEDYFNRVKGSNMLCEPEDIEAVTVFLIAVMVVWQALLTAINLKKNRPVVTALPTALFTAALLAIGEVPSAMSVVVNAVGFLGLVSMNYAAGGSYKAALKCTAFACLIFAAVTGSVIWAMPEGGYLNEANKESIRAAVKEKYTELGEYIEENGFNPLKQNFGISKGRLDRAGNLEYTGETVMRVTMGRYADSPIYLKAYGAGIFKNNRWRETDAGDAVTEDMLRNIWNIGYETLGRDASWPMLIEPEASVKGHLYIPYGTHLGGKSCLSNEGYALRLDGGQSEPLDYSGPFFEMMSDVDGYAFYRGDNSDMRKYNEYVRENYLSTDGMSERFKTDYKTSLSGSAAAVTDYIQRRFDDDGIFYTLEPGSMPYSGNVIEYFLYENKKGYCMHFASAAVMIYRLNGIPARYAEGYVIPQGSFKQKASGYDNGDGAVFVSEVRDYQAHAWPEIYIDDFGWVPVEVTPAYTGDNMSWLPSDTDETQQESYESETETESKESSTSEETRAETENKESSQNDSSVSESDNRENAEKDWGVGTLGEGGLGKKGISLPSWALKTLLITALMAAALIMAAVITSVRQKRTRALLKAPYGRNLADTLWRYTVRFLTAAGVTSAKENDVKKMLSEIREKALSVDENALADMMDKLLKAAYSRDGLSEEEYVYIVRLYEKLSGEIYETLNHVQKFKADVIYCLPHGNNKGE